MTNFPISRLALAGLFVLIAACSSTTLSGSWKNPEFSGRVQTVYIVGIARDEITRRLFEDRFKQALQNYGVSGIASYRDFPTATETDQNVILRKAEATGATAVLLTRTVGKRTEEVVNPGRVTSYDYGPRGYYPRYAPSPYYRDYGSFYSRSRELVYEPATVTQFEVVTIEANLYDSGTQELIWSAQLETVADNNLNNLIGDFIETVTEDMHEKGLI